MSSLEVEFNSKGFQVHNPLKSIKQMKQSIVDYNILESIISLKNKGT